MALSGTSSEHQNDLLKVGGIQLSGIDANAVMIWPINTTVAAAGTVLADAAQLYPGFTIVTGANGTVGVKLPATPAPGTVVIIKGTTSGVLKVWPDAAATINAIGANGAMSLASGVIPAIFIATSATQWYTLPLLPS